MRWLYLLFAGYGYYPLLTGIWMVLAVFIAGQLTALLGNPPVQAINFDPVVYGASVVVPLAANVTPSTWTISEPLCLVWALVVLKTFGWVQTGILLGGITGLLKKG